MLQMLQIRSIYLFSHPCMIGLFQVFPETVHCTPYWELCGEPPQAAALPVVPWHGCVHLHLSTNAKFFLLKKKILLESQMYKDEER